MKQHILAILILIFLSWWAIRPLTTSGFFPMHDDTQVGRVVAMGKALRNGQFPVRWVSDLGYGYGYPIFNFYGPLPYYVGGAFYALGLSGLAATKLMFALGIILSSLTMYVATVGFFGSLGAILASVFYLYAPYHAVQMFVRGAVGEFWVLVFLPLIVWGVLKSCEVGTRKRAALVAGVGLAGVILSHTILGYVTTVLLTIGLGLYWFVRVLRKKFDRSEFMVHGSMLVVGLSLSAFFWLPAIAEMRFTNVADQVGPTANYLDHFVCLPQLWDSLWGFGGSAAGCIDGMSFKLGKLQIFVALAAILYLVHGKRPSDKTLILGTAAGLTLVSVIFMLPISAPAWKLLPQFGYVQYPWRFLTFATLGLSLLAGGMVFWVRASHRLALAALVVAGAIALNAKLFVPAYTYQKEAGAFETQEELRFRVSSISSEYLPAEVPRPPKAGEVPGIPLRGTANIQVDTEIDTETYVKLALLSKSNETVTIERADFPGWRYWVNDDEVRPLVARGLPRLSVPEGASVVQMRFTNTPVRTTGNIVSLMTVLILLFLYGKKTFS